MQWVWELHLLTGLFQDRVQRFHLFMISLLEHFELIFEHRVILNIVLTFQIFKCFNLLKFFKLLTPFAKSSFFFLFPEFWTIVCFFEWNWAIFLAKKWFCLLFHLLMIFGFSLFVFSLMWPISLSNFLDILIMTTLQETNQCLTLIYLWIFIQYLVKRFYFFALDLSSFIFSYSLFCHLAVSWSVVDFFSFKFFLSSFKILIFVWIFSNRFSETLVLNWKWSWGSFFHILLFRGVFFMKFHWCLGLSLFDHNIFCFALWL